MVAIIITRGLRLVDSKNVIKYMRKIKLNKKGKYAIIDDSFYEEFSKHTWYLTGLGYASRSEWNPKTKKGKTIYMHRMVVNTPVDKQTDHINLNKLDNRKENLRTCTRAENLGHIPLSSHNKSGFKGVSFHKRESGLHRWRASISIKNKIHHLGYFFQIEEAAKAYNTKALQLFGKFALLNKV